MIAVVVERGYVAATVAQVISAAGVSRRTFYNHYGDKKDAFFDVYGQVTEFLCGAMAEAGEAERGGWALRVRAELAALLDCLSANPDLALFTLAAPPAAGGEVAALHRVFLERVLTILAEGRPKRARRPPPAAEYAAVGGLAALVVAAAQEGAEVEDLAAEHEDGRGAEKVRALLPEVTELVLTPYLGREAAEKAAVG
jgi:AcrR family transcriptional regulator